MSKIWRDLNTELERWKDASIYPIFWIRDDDAIKDGPKLTKLIYTAKKFNTPLSIAVIPFLIEKNLIERLNSYDLITVLQHGFKHKNYEPNNQKKSEFGQSRDLNNMIADIFHGTKLISEAFEKIFEPIFVPPWNRMNHLLLPYIYSLGIKGVSSFNKNLVDNTNNKSIVMNTNIDIIDWKKNKKFIGEEQIIQQLIFELISRRNKKNEGYNEPIGILTHHNQMNDSAFLFLEKLILNTKTYGAQWNSIKEIIMKKK
tara:strand:- start:770 stop:1540 length:771 start_codon:yes stop_codon:yes gene_type:complete